MKIAVEKAPELNGQTVVPGDKSISHRAVMLGALADGITEVSGFLPGADCRSTVRAFRQLGVKIDEISSTRLRIHGVGVDGLKEAEDVLDVGNSGTTIRLLLGILAGQPFHTTLTGDASIRRRPMGRVTIPLRQMGAVIDGRGEGKYAPLSIRGGNLSAIRYETPMASAQVKSCILLAGLYAEGVTGVKEPTLTRDYTERMLRSFSVDVFQEDGYICVRGGSRLRATDVHVPGDISSAAFPLVAACLLEGSEILIENVGINSTRTGLIDALIKMGAEIRLENTRMLSGEVVADLWVKGTQLRAAEFGGDLIPRMIDEIPILAVAATQAEGRTVIRDAAELRVKESDRLHTITTELRKMGARIEELEDGLIIDGPTPLVGATCESYHDHRIGMALAVAGSVAEGTTVIRDCESVDVSFPGFCNTMNALGCKMKSLSE
ncbi:3-phosphoshikimate 1-carboxyvinyltransferase [Collibacillus ludicampi]|jgi:3-phosphoshikimate 1-carboxyvinyltransferase|uniref:3-phosphoshikimate 1-carboxyvinyltransferase n=1 Tax=Collibacillus ludicampi TaxID=2771369 RepID=A0AAV4LK69_9BACL|nr:3-phosphoshikimate 1-carboxyvinyltransferase [Collibacillus ludicampi]GIM48171.1 3-phosphoshikimate 1-carboxyvinyltransferase [Collibacillus ludicampi]